MWIDMRDLCQLASQYFSFQVVLFSHVDWSFNWPYNWLCVNINFFLRNIKSGQSDTDTVMSLKAYAIVLVPLIFGKRIQSRHGKFACFRFRLFTPDAKLSNYTLLFLCAGILRMVKICAVHSATAPQRRRLAMAINWNIPRKTLYWEIFARCSTGFTVCRSSPDIRPLGHESMFHSIDLIDDNEIVRPQRVDIIAPVHGSHDRPSEHGMRIRRASDGGNGSSSKEKWSLQLIRLYSKWSMLSLSAEGEHLTGDENGLTGETSPSVVDTTIAPSSSTTESDINVDESFEAYLVDFLKKNPDVQMLRSPKDFDNQKNSWTWVNLIIVVGSNMW